MAALVTALGVLALLAPVGESPAATPDPPRLQASSAILVEASSGDIALARAADRRRPVASTTKLMTALVTLERAALNDVFPAAAYSALPIETKINLRAGERMTVRDLLRGLLLASANDAAATLAENVSGSRAAFVAEMNARARRLGLANTSFANPIGLDDPANYSSAADLVKLTLAARRHRFFRETVDLPRAVLRSGSRTREISNRNQLLRQAPFVSGVKTGHTLGAGYVLVGSATRGGVTVVSAVLGEPSEAAREADTLALLRFGVRRYRRVRLLRAGRPLTRVKVRHRDEDTVTLASDRSVTRVVRREARPRVRVRAPRELEGPLPRGARVGTVTVTISGRVIARAPLHTEAAVPAAGVFQRLRSFLAQASTLAVTALIAGAILLLALARGRNRRRSRRTTEMKAGSA